MKTLLQLCADVDAALSVCRDAEGAALYKRELAHEDFLHAAHALADAHKEIADMCRVANSPKLALRNALRPHVPPDGMLLFRNAFRWMRDMGPDADSEVMPNHFETASSEQLAEEFNYEILADYRHVIIVRPRRAR